MSEQADEPVDQDLLLAFSTEPGQKPSESTESLALRVECLERALSRSSRQVSLLESELATLVGAIDDIKKPKHSGSQPPRRSRTLSAAAGFLLGIAIAMGGWTMWSRTPMEAAAAAPAPVPVEQPVTPEVPPQPTAVLAAARPAAASEVRPRAVSVPVNAEAPIDYVGTLSIDAAPGGEVFIDRQPAGRTPLRVQDLKAGSHLVWIERDGYRRFTRVVQVPANRVSRVWADLEPLAVR